MENRMNRNQLIKQNQQKLKLIFLALLVIAAGICFLRQFRAYQSAQQLLEQELQRQHAVSKHLASARILGEREQQLAAKLSILTQLIPDEAEEEQLLLGLQQGLQLAGMRFMQLSFAERISRDGFIEIPLQMVFYGNNEQFKSFLEYLQSYERALRIDEMYFTADGEKKTGYFNLRASVFAIL